MGPSEEGWLEPLQREAVPGYARAAKREIAEHTRDRRLRLAGVQRPQDAHAAKNTPKNK